MACCDLGQICEFIGPICFNQLLRAFGSAKKAWEAPAKEFEKLGWGSQTLQKLKISKKTVVTSRKDNSISGNYTVLTREEPGYPQNLLQVDAPPPVFYTRGELLPRDRLALGVVGSRKMTSYGRDVVEALVPELSLAGLI